ncbi:hypothetical protein JCM19238_22 [Vibrio ponticus]|nr:hypothetical protein JCM19238_22 [Vibrio ponticus]
MQSSTSLAMNLLRKANSDFDLTNQVHQTQLLALADELLALENLSIQHLRELSKQYNAPLEFQLATTLVESRRKLLSITKPITVGIVFAMWGEHHRLLEKSSANPNGEDSLRTKIRQLEWVCAQSLVQWQLICVDDGCHMIAPT